MVPSEDHAAVDRKDWIYHYKSPSLLSANPLGMVPTLVCPSTSRVVTESLICVEFVDDLARSRKAATPPLLPRDPFERAEARAAGERANKSVTAGYYACLVRPDPDERSAAFAKILGGLADFTAGLKGGPFWGGSQTLTSVDCALFPYAWRLYVLGHYRGFHVPGEGDGWVDYQDWLKGVGETDYVRETLPDKGRYLEHVEKYASGRARSKVGNAVRRGVSANDYDDEIDGDEDGKR